MSSPRFTFLRAVMVVAAFLSLASCMLPPPPAGTSYRQQTRVPNVVGRSLGDAQTILARYHLTTGTVDYQTSAYSAGTVIGQHPYRRTRVYYNTAVRLTVSSGTASPAVVVPRLIGMHLDRASSLLTSLGLVVGNISYITTTRHVEGTVVAHTPLAGRQAVRGTSVAMTVATSGPALPAQTVTVPQVTGLALALAQQTLKRYRLRYSVSYVLLGTTLAGTVARQNPRAGVHVPEGSMVTLTVPRAVVATVVRVPRLVGLDLARARAGLSAAGLTLGNVTYHDGAPEGLVYRQVPTAGTRVRTTTRVDVVLGRRARPTLVTVPNIIGRIVEDAREIILRAGLVPGTVTRRTTTDPRIRNGQVISQNPTAGRYVAKGTALQIVVAQKSVPTIRVPVLTNLALAAARARLTAMGLLVGRVTYKVSTRPGVVLTQNPSANSRVYRGTKVNLVVGKQSSTPPPTQDIVRVPSVVLRGEADARKILERAGLKVGRILRVPGLPRKRVAVQIPLPGVRVKKGSKVTLHITR